MQIKLCEIRDRGTNVQALAIRMSADAEPEEPFLARTGFKDSDLVYVVKIDTQEAHYDPFDWRCKSPRTMFQAHRYIQYHFDELPAYAVIDVEYILGEADKPKTSEIWRV
ncbi:MAG: hypothetical protein NC311_15290 [Muribaculaceae bacterium]|nr:hypothetical protein [Muribaculaceae bacterium]